MVIYFKNGDLRAWERGLSAGVPAAESVGRTSTPLTVAAEPATRPRADAVAAARFTRKGRR